MPMHESINHVLSISNLKPKRNLKEFLIYYLRFAQKNLFNKFFI